MRLRLSPSRLRSLLRRRLVRSSQEALVRRGLQLGRNVYLGDDVYLDYGFCWLITIGDDSALAPRVFVLAHDASMKLQTGYSRVARTTIGPRTFVGAGSIILPGVTIGADCVIGAGSVVSRDIPDGSLAVGSPARVIGRSEHHGDRHRELMASRPTWPAKGWTEGGGITDAHKATMLAELSMGHGYVE